MDSNSKSITETKGFITVVKEFKKGNVLARLLHLWDVCFSLITLPERVGETFAAGKLEKSYKHAGHFVLIVHVLVYK